MDEVSHAEDRIDVADIVTVQMSGQNDRAQQQDARSSVLPEVDTAKGGEATHEVGFEGHRRLNALDAVRCREIGSHDVSLTQEALKPADLQTRSLEAAPSRAARPL